MTSESPDNGDNKKPNRALINIETQLLVKRLKNMKIGEKISYEDLSGICGRNVRWGQDGHGALYSDRKVCLRESQMVFSAVTNWGIQRLNDEEIAQHSLADLKIIRRRSKFAAKKLACVEYDGLSKEAKIDHNRNMAIFLVIGQFTKPSTLKLMETKTPVQQQIPPTSELLKMFMEKK